MIIKLNLLAFGLIMLSACGAQQQRAESIKVVAETRQCPALPRLPADLAQPPRKIDFLSKMP